MRRIGLALVVLATTGGGSAVGAQACTCADKSTKELYESMDAAFTGKLRAITASADGRFETFRYRVRRDYKRNLGDKVRVRVLARSSCRLDGDKIGRRYSLFLYRSRDGLERTNKGPWTSNACLETTRAKLHEAADESRGSADSSAEGCTAAG